MRRAGACAARCSRGNTASGCPGAKNVRESRDPRWQLEQHREQSALLDPQQQHADELEQQHRVPCCEARERAARPVGRRTTAKAAGQNRGVQFGMPQPCRVQGPPGRPGCPLKSGQPKKRRPAAVSSEAKAAAGYFCRKIVNRARRMTWGKVRAQPALDTCPTSP